jgi:N-methylhydantoinase A
LERAFEIPNDRYRVAIDTGGTFTDLVIASEHGGARWTVKVPSTPDRPSDAVLEAIRRTGVESQIASFVLGTTVATNALIQRTGERTLYVTTAGFEDVPFIQRINRHGLYDLQWVKPAPYVSRSDCLGVLERVASDGSVRTALEEEEIQRVISLLGERDGAIAINLLFSFVNREHEQRLAAAVREAFPERSVSVASELAPVWREYERATTVIVDASLKRLVADFTAEVDAGLADIGVSCPRFFLKSNGGQVTADAAARRPVDLTLSGLAGGLIGGKYYADAIGLGSVVTLDMGGTSADVGLILDGRIRSATQYEFEWGMPIIAPVVDLTTIGAGGSSIAGLDTGGLIKVGPESAGALPGPACYGRGGSAPTVTDANVVLGRLNPDYFLGGELPLDPELARAAVQTLGQGLGLGVEDTAQAIVELAVENMANAIRLLCADRGVDYRSLVLMAFGGAGPLHASLIGRRLGLEMLVIPPEPGLASALGALVADLRVDRRVTRSFRSDEPAGGELRAALHALADEALRTLHEEGQALAPAVIVSAACRYVGQNYEHEVSIALEEPGDLIELVADRFHALHEATYGYRLEDATVEIVHLGATAVDDTRASGLGVPRVQSNPRPAGQRPVFFKDQGWTDTEIVHRDSIPVGVPLAGPIVIEEHDSTVLVLDGQQASRHETGALILESLVAPGERTATIRGSAVVG